MLSEQEIFRMVSTGEMTKLEALEYFKMLNSMKEKQEEVEVCESTKVLNLSEKQETGDEERIQKSIAYIVSDILQYP